MSGARTVKWRSEGGRGGGNKGLNDGKAGGVVSREGFKRKAGSTSDKTCVREQ